MHRPQLLPLLFPMLLAPQTGSALDCGAILVEKQKFNLKSLGGPHSVVTSQWYSISEKHLNTTYTLDLCAPLKKSGDTDKHHQCPVGTRGEF